MTEVVPAGLPNITGSFNDVFSQRTVTEGAFQAIRGGTALESGGSVFRYTFTFDASRSNPIYGTSETVMPPTLSLIPQIKY